MKVTPRQSVNLAVRLICGVGAAMVFFMPLMVSPAAAQPRWSIEIHGGAGVIDRADMDSQTEAQYRAALNAGLERGALILRAGGSSLDAVQAVIGAMEDDPLFNAGRGAVFGADGKIHLDASIMDGRTRAAGAVADITHTRHPIMLARAVMEHSPHVFLVGEGAEEFGHEQGLEQVQPAFFFTERRWRQLIDELAHRNMQIPPRPIGAPPAPASYRDIHGDDHKFGTVGAVAMDTRGNLAAGTSTGGLTAKLWGRVGDTPIIGAGTYAQNGVCAVSATGSGEYFIRTGVARDICARMELRHESAERAAREVFAELDGMHGEGGVLVLDGRGHGAWRFNTPGMYRARLEQGRAPVVAIYGDEP